MITGSQIRAARNAISWTIEKLAKDSGTSVRTIIRMESADGVPNSFASRIQAIKNCLESAGIEFIGTPDDGPGIRIRPTSSKG